MLYLVPTPIGNLEDMTYRAVRILGEVDTILAEDTRTSRVLMERYGIKTPMLSHHKFNEHKSVFHLVDRMEAGENIALISDAGTPSISDPGFLLVRTATERGIRTECLPGATAFVPALVVSGLPSDRFRFEGFLPTKKGRQTRLENIATYKETTILYESPYRVLKTLQTLNELCGEDRRVSVSREISKKFEETVRGSLKEVIEHFKTNEPKGEFVIVLSGMPTKEPSIDTTTKQTIEY